MIKKLLFSAGFTALGVFATAQTSFDVGIFGMANTPWIINNNVSDQGDDMDFAVPFKVNAGLSAVMHISPTFGLQLEVAKGAYGQKWQGEFANGDTYESNVHINAIDIPFAIRLGEKGYFELGVQYSLLSGHKYEISSTDITGAGFNYTADVDTSWGSSNFSGILGFGANVELSEKLYLVTGLRFSYGFTDLEGTDSFNNSFKNDEWLYVDPAPNNDDINAPYEGYEKSYTVSGGFKLGLIYRFGD